jgi:hypothetical protein
MYTINTGTSITTLYDLIVHAESIIAEYGNLPVYVENYSPSIPNEVPATYITIKPISIREEGPVMPLRLLVK